MTVLGVQICMVMYTFSQWIKIYRHLTMGGYPKKACPQQLLETVNEHDKYTFINITVICVSFRRNKVIVRNTTL